VKIKYTFFRYLLPAVLFVVLFPAIGQAQSWYNTSWNYRKAITIDASKVGSGTHTDFPVLIDITDAQLAAHALSTGNDILFTASDGTTKISHEIESYTSASGDLTAWVEVPSLSSSTNTVIYMYYGNSSASNQQNVTGTWDANFRGVYHLNGSFLDATSYSNDGANTSTTSASGKISNGRSFYAANGADYIVIPGLMGSPANITLSAWVRLTTFDGSGCEIISLGDKADLRMTSTAARGLFYNGSSWIQTSSGSVNYSGAWHYLVTTFTSGSQKVYVDGVQVGSTSTWGSISYAGLGSNTIIGRHGNGGTSYDFTGTIDEVRVASSVRSAGWVLTEYNNQNSPSTFITVQGCESKPPTVVTPVSYCQNAAATQLSATGSNLSWGTGVAGTAGGTGSLASATTYVDNSWSNQKVYFTTTINNVTITSVDYYIPRWQGVSGLVLSIYNGSGSVIATSPTTTTYTSGASDTKITVPFGYTIGTAGNYSIGISSGSGNVGGNNPSFPITEATGTINVTGISGGYQCFNNIQFTKSGSSTAPTPSTASVGSTNYVVTQTLSGCVSDPATITVNVLGNVGTPSAITVSSGVQPSCQLTNGTTTTTYSTTASNSTGFNWSVSNASAGSINSSGVMTWANGFSGSVNIRVTANGCNGPSAMVSRAVSISPTVGTPVFTAGATSSRCMAAGSITYGATASNTTGITYSLDATSLAAGNSIAAATGAVTFTSGWSGTSVITASAAGCNGPKTATHTVTTGAQITNNLVDFSNGIHGVLCGTANENASVSMTAPAGTHFISVGFASYGTPTGSCSSFATSSCHAAGSQGIVENYLLGNNAATIPATNAVFGDPCQGTVKRLYVEATYGQSVCAGSSPGVITGTTPSGGTGIYTYYWEQSTTGPSSGFGAAAGTNNGMSYTPGILNQTTWFRRTVTSGTCSDVSTVIQVTVSTPGSATISYTGNPFCRNAAAQAVTRTGFAGGIYSSTLGLTMDSVTGQITPASSTPGSYTVTYTMVNGGCTTTATAPVTITSPPSATISYAGSPYCSSSGTASVTRTGTAGGTYSSTAGLVINSSTGAVTLASSTAGTYTVTYTIPAGGGCALYTATTSITITQQPLINAYYPGSPYCSAAGGVVYPTATIIEGAAGALSMTPGLVIDYFAGANLAVSTPGNHTVTYTVPASGGCAQYVYNFNITISAPSAATISYPGSPFCASAGVAAVTRSGTSGGTYVSTSGLALNASTGAITPAGCTPGTYTVYYIMANGGCTDTATTTVTINPSVAAGVSIAPTPSTPVCAGSNITYNATPANGGAAPSYQWKVNGVNAGSNSPSFSNAALVNGDLITCVMTSNASCATGSPATSNAVTASVIALPTLTNAPAKIICSGDATAIDLSASKPAGFAWTVGSVTGGITGASAGAGPSINQALVNPGSTAGTVQYLVTPTATAQAYSSTATGNQSYGDRLGAVFTVNSPITVTSLGIYDDGGDGFVGNLQVGILRNSDGAVMAGPLTMTGSSDSLYDGYRMRAIAPVTLPVGAYTVVSVGHSASDKNANSTISGPGTILNTGSGAITFNSSGYGGTGMGLPTVSNAGNNLFHGGSFRFNTACSGSQSSITVTVNPQPAATISYAGSPYCSSSGIATATRTGTTGGTYSSTAGLSINAATGDVNLAASTAGTYTVTYTVPAAGGCSSFSTTAGITITTQPLLTASYPGSPYCGKPGVVYPTATALQGAYGTVSGSAGLVMDGFAGVDLAATPAGSYTVTYTVPASGGCPVYSTSFNIVISAPSSAAISYPGSPLCTSGGIASVSRTGTAGGAFTAAAGLTLNASSGDITPAASTPGAYTVYYVMVNGGCTDTATTSVIIDTPSIAAISYAGTPFCTGSSTGVVTRTGTAGGVFSSTAGLTIDSATGAISPESSSPGVYTVTYTMIHGGCTSTATTSVTITAPASATISYAASPLCSTGGTASVTRTGTAGGTYSAAPAGLTLNASTGAITPTTSTPGTYTVTYTVAAAGGCPQFSTTTSVIIAVPGTWTGAVSTAWHTAGNWYCGAIPTINTDVVIASGLPRYPVVSSGTRTARNITIQSGATLTVTTILQIAGSVTNNGTFTASNGTVEFKGATAQSIPAALFATDKVKNLTINNAAGVTLGGALSITGVLKATTGNFSTGNYLTLISSATQTALIDGTGAGNVLGNVTMQRYLPSGFGYRYISSPFQAAKVAELADDVDLNASFPTLYRYDEDLTYAGWVKHTDTAGLLNPLEGYAVNFGASTSAKTINMTGAVNNGAISPVTLYNHNRLYTQGFNLAGNPYPSPLDWTAAGGWTKTNVDNAIYYFNNGLTDRYQGTYSSYINGVSSDGIASNIIPSMQGFFIHVSNGGYPVTASLAVNNSARTTALSPAFHKETNSEDKPLIRISAGFEEHPGMSDPAVIYFDAAATPAYDPEQDALKMLNTDERVPSLYSVSADSRLSINAMPDPGDSARAIPLGLQTDKAGWLVFTARDMNLMPAGLHIYFADALTGLIQSLEQMPTYRVQIGKGAHHNRFYLLFSRQAKVSMPGAGELNAYAVGNTVIVNGGTGLLQITNALGQVVGEEMLVHDGQHQVRLDASPGIYIVTLTTEKGRQARKIFLGNP
jgi:hypothetical protein